MMRQKFSIDTVPDAPLRFLYHTVLGRCLLKVLVCPLWSRLVGCFLDSYFSTRLIPGFVRRHQIDMSRYENRPYRSYNDFFTRKLLAEERTASAPEALISPCDAKLTAYRIESKSRFDIKGISYTVGELLQNPQLARQYEGGICLVFRLTVSDYHRYCYLDDGVKEDNIFIPGVLHTVQPVALGEYPVFRQNCREYTRLHTKHFGTVVQVEVGALFVGRIKNNDGSGVFRQGDEKGRFEFGGSTIVVLLEKGAARLDSEFFENTADGFETAVRIGERIGSAPESQSHGSSLL